MLNGEWWMVDGGWWIHSEFKIAHSKFRSLCGVCVSKRSWGVLILDFGFWILGWGGAAVAGNE